MSVTITYTDSMHALLDWFGRQPCSCATIGHITDEVGYSRETVRANLKQLAAAEHAEARHGPTGEYRLIGDPRDGHASGGGHGDADLDAARRALEDLVAAMERGDRRTVEDRVDDLWNVIGDE